MGDEIKLNGLETKSNADIGVNNNSNNDNIIIDVDEDEKPKNGNAIYNSNQQGTLYDEGSSFSLFVEKVESSVHLFVARNNYRIKAGIFSLLLLVYLAYFVYCMQYRFGDEGSIVLLVITICLAWKLLFKYLDSQNIQVGPPPSVYHYLDSAKGKRLRTICRYLAYILALIAIIAYLSLSVFPQHPQNIQPFVGMLVLIALCFVFSAKPSKVNWHPVFWSFVIQFAVAALTLQTQVGYDIFDWLGDQVENLFSFADDGSKFVIGEDYGDMGLAFQATGLVIFSNSFIFLMNHWGVIEFIVLKVGRFMALCLDTGPVESVIAAANIFIGLTEAPLLIRPYLPTVTDSELHTIMTCGFASVSGASIGVFANLGVPTNHLLTAAVISSPAALAFSKLMYPETSRVAVEGQENIKMVDKSNSNSLNAYSQGAVMALTMSAAIWSNMLAFVSMLALLDALCVWIGERAGLEGVTFSVICSYVLYPMAYAIGVEADDCRRVGKLMGVRWFATPYVAYSQLGDLIENRKSFEEYTMFSNDSWHWDGDDVVLEAANLTLVDGFVQERTEVIATYALCGFSAFTAIGICLGSLGSLCPARKPDILRLVTRAFVAGNMASFATGAVAGILFTSGSMVS